MGFVFLFWNIQAKLHNINMAAQLLSPWLLPIQPTHLIYLLIFSTQLIINIFLHYTVVLIPHQI